MFFVWFFLCAKLIFHFLNIFVSKQFFPKYVGNGMMGLESLV